MPLHRLSKKDIQRLMRHCFMQVMATSNHILSVLGTAQAIDYSKMAEPSGRSGHSGCSHSYPLTDFTIDVENTAKQTLDEDDLRFFNTSLKGKDIDYSVQDNDFLRIQEKLGRAFYSRGLYPLQKYFTTVKR